MFCEPRHSWLYPFGKRGQRKLRCVRDGGFVSLLQSQKAGYGGSSGTQKTGENGIVQHTVDLKAANATFPTEWPLRTGIN